MFGLFRIFALIAILFSTIILFKHSGKRDFIQKGNPSSVHILPTPSLEKDSGICSHCSCIIHKEPIASHESTDKKD